MVYEQSAFLSASGQGVQSVTVATPTVPAGSSVALPSRYSLKSMQVVNRNAAARYIWVSAGAAGGTPIGGLVFFVPPAGAALIGSDVLGLGGINLGTTNFTVAISTSSTAYAAATAADHDITVYYRE